MCSTGHHSEKGEEGDILNPLWQIGDWADYCGNARMQINDRIRLWWWWSDGGNKSTK
jgi:hypothetical protein